MSITKVAQEYEMQTSADQDNEGSYSEETRDLTVPRINNKTFDPCSRTLRT